MERKNCEQHRGNFEELGSDGDAALAEAVGEETTGHGKKQKWNREKVPDQENAKIFLCGGRILPKDQINDKKLQPVIVERALKLRGNQTPETPPPIFTAGNPILRRCCWH